jgi:hypothetical protein
MKKKILTFVKWASIILCSMIVGAVLLGDDEQPAQKLDSSNAVSGKADVKKDNELTEPEVFKFSDTVLFNGVTFQVDSVKFIKPSEYNKPKRGGVIEMMFTIKNNNTESVYLDAGEFSLYDKDGNKLDTYYTDNSDYFIEDLQSGKNLKAAIAFDAPVDRDNPFELYYQPSWESVGFKYVDVIK